MANETAFDLADPRRLAAGSTEAAFDYLRRCYQDQQAVAVVIGLGRAENASVVQRFVRTLPQDTSAAHIATPCDSPHAFLEAILFQLGFEPFDASSADLQNLLTVYLRHERAQERRTVIAIESAQDFGPRVLEVLQQLSDVNQDDFPAALYLLTGTADLNRVLDSAPLTRLAGHIGPRFAATETAATTKPPRDVAPGGEIEILRDGRVLSQRILDRAKLIVGRSEHNDLSLASRYVSRHHALLINEPDGTCVVDLKSTNGTYVNSTRVEQQSLKHGDVISIGNYRLRYNNPERSTPAPIFDESDGNFADTVIMQSLSGESFES